MKIAKINYNGKVVSVRANDVQIHKRAKRVQQYYLFIVLGGPKMKITKTKLRQIIKEELQTELFGFGKKKEKAYG